MPVTDQIMNRARRSNQAAVETVLTDSFPAIYRMLHALTGDPQLAGRLVRQILRNAVRVMPKWRHGITPEHWFYHRALQAARELSNRPAMPNWDPLLPVRGKHHPAYAAFISALRHLPRQQMEAFILNHGERFNERMLGVTMDCSTSAAVVHLKAASQTLQQLAGDAWASVIVELEQTYQSLTPPPTIIRTEVTRQARTVLWLIRLRRLVRRVIVLTILVALIYAAWHWRVIVLQWIETIRQRATTTAPSP